MRPVPVFILDEFNRRSSSQTNYVSSINKAIFKLIVSNSEKILDNTNGIWSRQVKKENSSFLVAIRLHKTPRRGGGGDQRS